MSLRYSTTHVVGFGSLHEIFITVVRIFSGLLSLIIPIFSRDRNGVEFRVKSLLHMSNVPHFAVASRNLTTSTQLSS